MARAAANRGKRPQPDARRPRKRGRGRQLSAAEQTLFFSRIRRQAKWVFVLLALVFAGGFIFFGVGSGNNSSLGDLFNNLFQGGSGGPSISSAQKRIDKNPADAKAYHDLATAYQNKQRTPEAIAALNTYTALRPKDVKGLAELAGLQRTYAQTLQQDSSLAQYLQQQAYVPQQFNPSTKSPLGKALAADPLQTAVQTQASTRASDATNRALTAFGEAISTYQRLAKLRPNDPGIQLDLAQTAEAASNTTVEIAALKRAAKLLPDQAAQIQAKIKKLQAGVSG
jgi:tetratricopeptide (TPR) repeat protein